MLVGLLDGPCILDHRHLSFLVSSPLRESIRSVITKAYKLSHEVSHNHNLWLERTNNHSSTLWFWYDLDVILFFLSSAIPWIMVLVMVSLVNIQIRLIIKSYQIYKWCCTSFVIDCPNPSIHKDRWDLPTFRHLLFGVATCHKWLVNIPKFRRCPWTSVSSVDKAKYCFPQVVPISFPYSFPH